MYKNLYLFEYVINKLKIKIYLKKLLFMYYWKEKLLDVYLYKIYYL